MPFIVTDTGETINEITIPGGWAIMVEPTRVAITEAVPGEQGPQATVRFHVLDAASRFLFCQQALGQWSGTSTANLAYVGPFEYPFSTNLICTRIDAIESLGPMRPAVIYRPVAGTGNYTTLELPPPWVYGESAIVTATFTRPQWMPATNGGYFTIEFEGAGKKETIPGTYYTFDSNGVRPKGNVGLTIMSCVITVTRYRMPFLPDAYMVPLLDRVNAMPFQIGNVAYAAGTLLFGVGNSLTESDPLGNITYRAQYKFHYRYPGWNYHINPITLQWDTITPPIYLTGDFNTLP